MRHARLLRKTRPSTAAPWQVSVGLLREYHEPLFALGVTPAQARILLYLEQHPHSYIMQCARAFGLTNRTVGYPIRVLEQRRWVTKRRAPQDDRYVLITLTQKGRALVGKIRRHLAQHLDEI